MTTVFLRIRSHRAGDRLKRLLGVGDLDWHYTWDTGGSLVPVAAERVNDACKIPGVTRARLGSQQPHRCIRMSD